MALQLSQIPEAKPAFEYIDGELVQKVSPRVAHGLVQSRVCTMLTIWLDARPAPRGRIGTELDLDVGPNRFVPDIMYHADAAAALRRLEGAFDGLPDVVIEIGSPGDERRAARARKFEIYRSDPRVTVLSLDTEQQTVTVSRAQTIRTYTADERLTIEALPGFTPIAAEFFRDLKPDE